MQQDETRKNRWKSPTPWNEAFTQQDLQDLFLSVEWNSGKHPEKLARAIANSDGVVTAWEGDKLVGLVNALSDGEMTTYFQYVVVRPELQGKGVGRELMRRILDRYEHVLRKVLISYEAARGFYEKLGFSHHTDKQPMFITTL